MAWIESQFNSFDGLTLFYRYKKPEKDTGNTLLFLHRGHEHSGRIISFADKLSKDDYWCFSFDLRGHGRSSGMRAWASSFDVWVKDLNSFSNHICQKFSLDVSDIVVVSNSVGSVMAISWIMNYGPNLRGCILGAPAFSIKLYIPLALPFLRLLGKFSSQQFVTSYVRSSLLTRNKKEAALYDEDALITKKIGVNILVGLFDSAQNFFKRLKDFEVPVIIFTAENDYIVDNKYHYTFHENISSSVKSHIVLPGFRHAIFHENDQDKIISPSREFIKKRFNSDSMSLPMVIPQPRSHTVEEYKKLLDKGSVINQMYYQIYRWVLVHIGGKSKGVSTGLKYGFDSGVSLDYVYNNKPSGSGFVGKLIDKVYLNSVGWRGIKNRKKNLKKTLSRIMGFLYNENVQPVILDVAAGAGRYLFEVQDEEKRAVQLYINDVDNASLDAAKKIAGEYNSTTTKFINNDVFDTRLEWSFSQRPNIIVISGLFELYENNLHVHQVLSILYELLENNGYLVYTGQPWHPQLEIIGRLLNNRKGQRWVMRRRIQSELDQLIESSGFNKLNTEIEDVGIFTVSFAQKKNDTFM